MKTVKSNPVFIDLQVLSRAFRNRFVELHFDELPTAELETILHQRCCLPPSYCTKLVKVMQDLQVALHRSAVCVALVMSFVYVLGKVVKKMFPLGHSLCAEDRLSLRENMASSPSGICSAGPTATGWRSRRRPHGTGCSTWLTMVGHFL